MKIKFLGSGSAFNTDNFQSNMLIEKNGKRLLVDCGADLKMSLAWDIQEVNQKQMILNRTGLSSKDNRLVSALQLFSFALDNKTQAFKYGICRE